MTEDCVEVRQHFGRVPLLEADQLAGNLSVTIDDVGFRVHRSAVGLRDWRVLVFGARIAISGENDRLILQEFVVGGLILIRGHSDNDGVARRDVFL